MSVDNNPNTKEICRTYNSKMKSQKHWRKTLQPRDKTVLRLLFHPTYFLFINRFNVFLSTIYAEIYFSIFNIVYHRLDFEVFPFINLNSTLLISIWFISRNTSFVDFDCKSYYLTYFGFTCTLIHLPSFFLCISFLLLHLLIKLSILQYN